MLLQTIEIEPALRIVQQRAVVGQDEGGVLAVVEPMQGEDKAPTAAEVVASVTATPIALEVAMAMPTLTTTMVVETVLVEVALAIMIGGITPTVLQATLTVVAAAVVGVELPAEEGGEVEDVAVLPVAVAAVAVAGVQAALLVIGAVSLGTLPMPAQTIRSICIYFTIYLSIIHDVYCNGYKTYRHRSLVP